MPDATPAAPAATGTAAPAAQAEPQPVIPIGSVTPPAPPPGMGFMQRPPETPAPAAPAAEAAPQTTPAEAKPAEAGDKPTQKAEGTDRPGTAKEAAPPPVLDLKLPEGVAADPKLVGLMQDAVAKHGLSPEGAQAVAAGYAAIQAEAAKQQAAAWEQTKTEWKQALEADKDFGGTQFAKNVLLANQALKKFDPTGDLQAELSKAGLENWPPLAKVLARIGKADSEDSAQTPATPAAPRALSDEDRLRARYPKSPQMRP